MAEAKAYVADLQLVMAAWQNNADIASSEDVQTFLNTVNDDLIVKGGDVYAISQEVINAILSQVMCQFDAVASNTSAEACILFNESNLEDLVVIETENFALGVSQNGDDIFIIVSSYEDSHVVVDVTARFNGASDYFQNNQDIINVETALGYLATLKSESKLDLNGEVHDDEVSLYINDAYLNMSGVNYEQLNLDYFNFVSSDDPQHFFVRLEL